ncbi:MAG: hypothetical protein HY079_13885 [Elusimicrobia bacterium]|nr:hypothetical protein [Elusimicrobiota bacterium]
MSPQFRSFLRVLGTIFGLVMLCWVIRLASGAIVRSSRSCDDPCLDKSSPDASCQPLAASMQIETIPDSGGRTTIWYRAAIKNRSCMSMEFHRYFFSRDLEDAPLQNARDSFVEVTDESGNRVPERKPGPEAIFRSDERIRPYRAEFQGQEVIPSSKSADFIGVLPGAEVQTSREVLSPYRIRTVDRRSANGIATYAVRDNVPLAELREKFVSPPEGFRRLTGYDLRRPGRYTARFVFDQDCVVRVDLASRGRIKTGVLSILSLISGEPSPSQETSRRIHAVSNPVEFRVSK